MALFGKLFSKESCAICGQEVGTLKKRKLADGVMCKDCEAKLSPWFVERRESSIAQIKDQLAQREQNRQALEGFEVSKQFGDSGAFFFDETHGCFCAVAARNDGPIFGKSDPIKGVAQLRDRNVDIIELDQVTSVYVDINERRDEMKHSVDGEQVSYNPKRWRYSEDFWVTVNLDHPYIGQMKVCIGTLLIEVEEERLRNSVGRKVAEWLLDDPRLNVERNAALYDDNSLMAQLMRGSWEMPDYSYGFRCNRRNWESIQRYGLYLAMLEQIRRELTGE